MAIMERIVTIAEIVSFICYSLNKPNVNASSVGILSQDLLLKFIASNRPNFVCVMLMIAMEIDAIKFHLLLLVNLLRSSNLNDLLSILSSGFP